ncbi:MAG: LamG domain-containing protein [Cytophagia bacterium]|nr:MAG: LamG domain-containing protein [Cytophagia bacterium]
MKKAFTLLVLCCLMMFNTQYLSAQWTNVGTTGFSAGGAIHQSMKFHPTTGEPYVAYRDDMNGGKTTVMRFNGTVWVVVGTAGFSAGQANYQSLAFHPTTYEPYVAYNDFDGFFNFKTTVMRFTSGAWANVGTAGFSVGSANHQSLAFHPTTYEPYVAYQDNSNKTTVMRFISGAWANVGTTGFSAGQASYQSLAFHPTTGEPYVAYTDGGNSFRTTVMRFTSGAWANVGTTGFSAGQANYQSLAFHPTTGEPYVAYQDYGNSNKATVMQFTSGAWANVGIAGFSTGFADDQSLAFHPTTGEPYVAYFEQANSNKATVMRFTSGAWANVGTAGFSAGAADYQSLAFHPTTGEPYVAYQDYGNSNKTTVMRFPNPPPLEINLQGNSVSIADGDITPSTVDNTNFGVVVVTGGTIARTFTIQNTGGDILNITSVVSNNAKFVISGAPTTVAASSFATFIVTYTSTGLGTDNATITVNNNDSDEAVYDFAITGKQINALPTGVRGNTGNFSGVINQCMQTSNSFSIGSNDFTINLWVNPRNTQVGYANILNFQHTVGSSMVIQQNASATNQYYLAFASSVGTFNLSTNITLTSNQWQHLCYVKSGTNLIAYLNGMQIGTVTVPNSVYYTPQKLELGGDTQAGRPYNGLIDEVQIWNTVRTQAQIRESMHLTLSGTEAGLVSYYQFNETTGNVIDVVAGNNGALQNGATRISSDVAVAQGTAQRITPSVGLNTFTNANVAINFTTAPADEFVAYQLRGNSFNGVNALNVGTNTTSCYWIVRQFGAGGVAYNGMNFTLPSNNTISTSDVTTPSNLKLYKRPDNVTTAFPASFASGTSANNTTRVIEFTGFASQTSFSQFEIGSTSSPLPITLLSFEGKRTNENNVLLQWKTATELNNKGFEIESSKNSTSFTKIAFVDGAGNSTNIRNYQFNVQNSDDTYYRLKQIDFDGSFSYSSIIFVKGIENIVNVYPNPTTENIKRRFCI